MLFFSQIPPPFFVYYSIFFGKRKDKIVGTRIFAYGEDFHALRLMSQLPDLRAGNANLIPRRFARGASFEATVPQPTQKGHPKVSFALYKGYEKDIFCVLQ